MENIKINQGIGKFLDKKGLSQADLAKMTGLSTSYVSRIMSGERIPELGTLRTICQALGVTMSSLMHHSAVGRLDCDNELVHELALKLNELDELIYPRGGGFGTPVRSGKGGGNAKVVAEALVEA